MPYAIDFMLDSVYYTHMKSPKPAPEDLRFAVLATDVVCFRIIDGRLSVLLGKVDAKSVFASKWAVIGGLISPKDTADEAARKHLKIKAGISDIYMEQLYTFSAVERDPRGRVVSVAYMALTNIDPRSTDTNKAGYVETKWFPVDELPPLAYDHDEIIAFGLVRLRNKIRYTNIAQFLLPDRFTFSQLQSVYEVLTGEGVDKRNFRKKVMATNLLKDTGEVHKEGIMRPAALYTFTSKKIVVIEIL